MGMSKPVKFAHVVFRTDADHFEAVVDWWKTFLLADVRYGNDFICFLSYDDEHHRIAIINRGDLDERNHHQPGFEHVAYTYADVDALFDHYTRLKSQGILPVRMIHHGMTLSAYYADPDGNQAECQIDVGTMDEAMEFMASDVFANNPIGILVDFDELIERHADGDPTVTHYPLVEA